MKGTPPNSKSDDKKYVQKVYFVHLQQAPQLFQHTNGCFAPTLCQCKFKIRYIASSIPFKVHELGMPHSNAEPQLLFKCDIYLQIIPPGPRQISLYTFGRTKRNTTIKCQIQECQIHLPRENLSWHISRQETVLICTKITLMHTLGLWWYAIALAPAFFLQSQR